MTIDYIRVSTDKQEPIARTTKGSNQSDTEGLHYDAVSVQEVLAIYNQSGP